jgi:membrane protease YdiL (CAAX protease family)
MTNPRKQLAAFGGLLTLNALLALLAYVAIPLDQLSGGQPMPPSTSALPVWVLGLANAAIIIVVYGLLGLAGLWFALRLGLPGIFREGASWRNWLLVPMAVGLALGVLIIAIDRLSAIIGNWQGFTHPPFPLSLIASATAGIGEEILFRVFVLSLWAFLLNLILRRWKATGIALWIANIIAALAFAASHIPTAMILLGVTNPAQIPPVVLAELFLLNGIVGLVAGAFYMRYGMVAASGIHFWGDFMWHVLAPLWHLFLP